MSSKEARAELTEEGVSLIGSGMRTKSISMSVTLTIAVLILATAGAREGITYWRLDDLQTSKVGNFPKRWRTWPLMRGKAEKVYHVAEDSTDRFIRAYDDKNISQEIFLNFNWPVKDRPHLSWRWRATTLPAGADESSDNTNDSACGLYVVVGRFTGHAMKYVWSTTLPPGSVVTRRDGNLKIKVLDSGAAQRGTWVSHTVDVPADYMELFGGDLNKNPSGIGILTDGNAVYKPAGCDYADFVVSK